MSSSLLCSPSSSFNSGLSSSVSLLCLLTLIRSFIFEETSSKFFKELAREMNSVEPEAEGLDEEDPSM